MRTSKSKFQSEVSTIMRMTAVLALLIVAFLLVESASAQSGSPRIASKKSVTLGPNNGGGNGGDGVPPHQLMP